MKLTEKMLFETWLDIHFASELDESIVADLTESLKESKKRYRKTKRLLKKAAEHYFEINGRYPKTRI